MCSTSENDFSINILKALSLEKKSTVFSPFLILKDLTAVSLGFDDAGAKEKHIHIFDKKVLKHEITEHYSTVVNVLKEINKDDSALKLLFSSFLFLSNNHIASSFIDLMQKFEIHSDGKISAEKINNFISQNTEKQIREIISEENINSGASLMIANGLYFCGEWETPFQHYYDCLWLSHESVHLRRKERMMARTNHEEEWNFTEGATWKCLGIPFKGRKMWLHIILPKKAMGLAAVLEDFNADILKNCIFKKPSGDINVAIPIFHMENKFSLIETLTKLGINNIFEDIPLSTVINNKSEKLDNICHGSSIDINQFNIPKRVSSNSISNDNESPVERGFGAFQPFIYFVTLVENNVNELKTLLLMGTFY